MSETKEDAMAWRTNVLVVATITADSDELLAALRSRAERGPTTFTLLAPAAGPGPEGRAAAQAKLDGALPRLREAGLEVEGRVGDSDAVAAAMDAWDPRTYDAIVVSTLPTYASKWLMLDLPHRLEKMAGIPVEHVVAHPPKAEPVTEPVRKHERLGPLAPLSVMSWGGERQAADQPPR
jgi:hypothetical protein